MLLCKLAPYARSFRIQVAQEQIYIPMIAAQIIGSVGVKHAETTRQETKFR
jgi:hypothetical protein